MRERKTDRQGQTERKEKAKECKRLALNPTNPTYFSWGSHRIQGRVHWCGFNLIGVERLRHHRPEIVLFYMKEGSEGGWLLQEGLKIEETCRGPKEPFGSSPTPSVK